jgi:hypothetical protein
MVGRGKEPGKSAATTYNKSDGWAAEFFFFFSPDKRWRRAKAVKPKIGTYLRWAIQAVDALLIRRAFSLVGWS